MLPKVAAFLGSLPRPRKGLLWRWWRRLKYALFISSVMVFVDYTTYKHMYLLFLVIFECVDQRLNYIFLMLWHKFIFFFIGSDLSHTKRHFSHHFLARAFPPSVSAIASAVYGYTFMGQSGRTTAFAASGWKESRTSVHSPLFPVKSFLTIRSHYIKHSSQTSLFFSLHHLEE